MYYYLRNSLKRRLILELQDSFGRHPLYNKVVPHIQNRFDFKSRPQFGIVVKGSSGNKVVLAANNFVGTVISRVMLAYTGPPAYPLEWVREDVEAVTHNNMQMPTAPGVYYLEVLEAPTEAQGVGSYVLDPLFDVTQEPLIRFESGVEGHASLQRIPLTKTLRLWLNGKVLLEAGKDYNHEPGTETVEFIGRYNPMSTVRADYRYPGTTMGPFDFSWNTADFKALPGAVLAFGKRAVKGDRVAIRIYPEPVETAEAYGGKHEFTFDVDVIVANDPLQMEEIADLVIMYLWGEKKSRLEFEGIEVLDVSLGGESEEAYDETGDLNYYTGSLSIQLRADWEIHLPLPLTISKATTEKATGGSGLTLGVASGLYYATTPVVVNRNHYFERIR